MTKQFFGMFYLGFSFCISRATTPLLVIRLPTFLYFIALEMCFQCEKHMLLLQVKGFFLIYYKSLNFLKRLFSRGDVVAAMERCP